MPWVKAPHPCDLKGRESPTFLKAYEVEIRERYVWDQELSRPFRPPGLMGFLPQGVGLRPGLDSAGPLGRGPSRKDRAGGPD